MSRHPLASVTLILTLLVCALTWPQSAHLGTGVAWHNDPQFSIWRIAWIAHALQTDPHHLFDANIFFPARQTLGYSDATLLEGAVAAPLLWAGVPAVLVYNLLLLAGFVGSGVAMFVLTRHLAGSSGAALVAAAIFMMVPYRMEHFAHLELQWAMWIPLAFWAVHRAVEERSWRFGTLAGIFLWLQILSCVYYGVFLAASMAVLALLLVVAAPRRVAAALGPVVLGAALAALLAAPYASRYLEAARQVGPRGMAEVVRYSARPISYLAAPADNWIWGWTSARFGGVELLLFPGAIALALAAVAFVRPVRASAWIYLAVCAVAVELSFGANSRANAWVFAQVHALGGFRAWARSAIVAYCALAALAGIGLARIERRLGVADWRRAAAIGALVVALLVEYSSTPLTLTEPPEPPAVLYDVVRGAGRGVLLELPVPTTGTLPGREAVYMMWSTNHWDPLVNGYSGFYPQKYFDTLQRLERFPDDESIAHLGALGVRFVIVHRAFYPRRDDYTAVVTSALARRELIPKGRYTNAADEAALFELVR